MGRKESNKQINKQTKLTYSKESFKNRIRVSNSLDPDQARQNAGPDLAPSCLQMLSADDDVKRPH